VYTKLVDYRGVFKACKQMVMLKLKDVIAVVAIRVVVTMLVALQHLKPSLELALVRQECVT